MVFRGHSPAADDALETSRPAPRCHRAGETACPDALPIVALETLPPPPPPRRGAEAQSWEEGVVAMETRASADDDLEICA
jgi:hypothetical protein